MKAITLLAAAGTMALAPASALAVPGNSHGSTNGAGWIHLNGPEEGQTGQPDQHLRTDSGREKLQE